jgi:transcription-repair coupling factor (superfamily II helicase)
MLAGREHILLAQSGEETGRRFVEARNPERAFRKAFDEARAEGKRILVAGSARAIRFVARRIEQRTGEAPVPVSDWAEVRSAPPGAVLTATAELGRGWSEDGLLVVATSDILGERAVDTRRTGSRRSAQRRSHRLPPRRRDHP